MMDQIRAPYGFVPHTEQVVLPTWQGVDHETPLNGGLRGTLTLRLETLSPLAIRTGRQEEEPYRLPDARWAVPGSTLRGLLRGVIEPLTGSRLAPVNDHRYGLRDLQNRELYSDQMAQILPRKDNGKQEPQPLSCAGWLTRTADGQAQIWPCDFARIEYGALRQIAQRSPGPKFEPGNKQSAPDKYKAWGDRPLGLEVAVTWLRDGLPYGFGRVEGPGKTKSRLVFTGQPQNQDPNRARRPGAGNPKHHDFVFVPRDYAPLPVSEQALRDFEFVHGNAGQQHKRNVQHEPNPEWAHWRPRWLDSQGSTAAEAPTRGVPVFFLLDESKTQVQAFGLAMMFRLPYRYSTLEAAKHSQAGHEDQSKADFAQLLFGRSPTPKVAGWRGRVEVGPLVCTTRPPAGKAVKVVLSGPRASYYPAYVDQGTGPTRGPKGPTYRTWMDRDGRPAGFKRYRVVADGPVQPPPPKRDERKEDKTSTTFRPLPPGLVFEGKLRVHNVRPEELGALVWALQLGGDAQANHLLGTGRPLGYGRCRISITHAELWTNQDEPYGTPKQLQVAVDTFRAWAKAEVPAWEERAEELLALARPVSSREARWMQIDHPDHRNEFAAAKKMGFALLRIRTALRRKVEPAPTARQEVRQVRAPAPRPEPRSEPRSEPRPVLPLGRAAPATPQTVTVVLTGQNGKKKWQAREVGGTRGGTFGDLSRRADRKVGDQVTAKVINPNRAGDLELKWTDE